MKNKIILIILISILLVACLKQEASLETKKEVNLTNVNRENIEEDINGFNIDEDKKITNNTAYVNKNILEQFNQKLSTQTLSTDYPNNGIVLEEYQSILPEGIIDKVSYDFYQMSYNYFLITNEEGFEVRDNPSENGIIVGNLNYLDKVTLLQRVQGEMYNNSDIWFNVFFPTDDEIKSGYIHSSSGILRSFRFEEMNNAVMELINELNEGKLNYISNYKNINGDPPKRGDALVDEHGYRSYHSAPAYLEANTNSDFRYIPDGILVKILEEIDGFYHIYVPTFGSDFYVPKKYIDQNNILEKLNHVIVVDRNQQNQAAFEVGDNGLNLISYTLSTTGVPGEGSYETTLGSYKAIEKKDSFYYLVTGKQEIAGYAPYAIRFTGGAYIHGVPVAYITENGKMYDPGQIEYLHTIGTFPRSNMCVRNYTSHAEYLYNWMDTNNGAVIVID